MSVVYSPPVSATMPTGNVVYSNAVTATIPAAAPGGLTPGAIALVSVTSTSVTLRWSAATGGTAPRTSQLQASADGVAWSAVSGATGTSYTDTTVSGPQRKLYRVAQTDADSTVVFTDPLTVDVPVVAVCWINDARVEDLGLEVEDLSGYNDGTAPSFGTLSFPGMVGGYATGPGTTDARVVRLAAYLTPASLAEQEAALDTVADALQGVLELRFGDAPDKVLLGIAGKPAWQPLGVGMVDGEGIVTVDITCADPTKRSRYPTSVSFGSVRKPLPVGTLSSVGLLQVMGPATNPVVTIRGANGEVSSQLGFTATLTNAEYLEVDLGRKTVAKVTSGTRAGALASWDGSTDFFALDPGDADRAAGSYATAECSGGGTAILHYFLRYSS